jgi:hypothetical protein
MEPAPTNIEPAALSAAAERMRLHRERRCRAIRCVTVQLRDREVDAGNIVIETAGADIS